LIELVRSDLHRRAGSCGLSAFLRYILESPGFQLTFWLRLVAWLRQETSLIKGMHPLAGLARRDLSCKDRISMPASMQIGPGFYIGHFGGIGVNQASAIGGNCNTSQGVTLGQANRGERAGAPSIGDNAYIGPDAKVVGRAHAGSNVAFGADADVTRDVADNAVVGGIPAKVLSYEGSAPQVNSTNHSILKLQVGGAGNVSILSALRRGSRGLPSPRPTRAPRDRISRASCPRASAVDCVERSDIRP